MADNSIVLKVVADYKKAIKEWEELRDNVADTSKEYQDAQKEIETLKKSMAELTGETIKSNKAFKKETESQRESTKEYKNRKKELESAFAKQTQFNNAVGSSSVLSFNNSINAVKKERNALIELRNTLDVTGDEFTVVSNKIAILDQKLKTSAKGMSGSLGGMGKGLDGTTKASGAATSAVLELGRVVQDAPYGLRGMANNITQLASQMAFATKASGGFKNALKDMGKAFLGPMGIIFAISLLVSAIEMQNAAKKTAIDIEKKLKEAIDATLEAMRKVQFFNQKRIDRSKEILKIEEDIKDAQKRGDNPEKVNRLLKKKLDLQIESAKVNKITLEGVLETEKGTNRHLAAQKALYKANADLYKLERERARLDIDSKGDGSGKLLSIDDFDEQLEDYLSQIASVQEKEEILLAKLESDKILIQEKYHLERLEAKNKENQDKFKQQAAAYRIEYKAFLDQQVRLGKIPEAEAEASLDNFDNDITAQQEASQANFNTLISKTKGFYFEKLFLALQSEQKETEIIKNGNNNKLEEINSFIEQYKSLLGAVSSFIDGEYERQLTTEQNKTNALNQELNNRLLNENLSKEQRKSIQTQIWQNDEKLRLAQEKIEKKRFKMQKAANISMALVDTYLAATKALKNFGGVPTGLPAMAATIATGLVNVATIARQKFQSSSAATPPVGSASSGGGDGVGDREFNFNLVGNTQTNQLAEAIQGQFSQPLKAFVVSKDVTTQQELDANIKGTATF